MTYADFASRHGAPLVTDTGDITACRQTNDWNLPTLPPGHVWKSYTPRPAGKTRAGSRTGKPSLPDPIKG